MRTISSPEPSTSRSTWLVTVTGNASLPVPPVRADQPQVEEQRLLDRDLARLLVDEVEPLARAVEDGAEVGADRRRRGASPAPIDAARLARRPPSPSLGNACAATTSTPSGPSTSGRTYDAAEKP